MDILRLAGSDAEARAHVESSTVVVADGKPLIWASRIERNPLPERVAGSDLIWSISAAMAATGRSIYLLGGEPGAGSQAAAVLRDRHPSLGIGHLSPAYGFDQRPDEYQAMLDEVAAAKPDFVFVGLGFPKQERVIERLRPLLPNAWFMGCGAAIGFVAGTHRRAPKWMQDTGLEWVHRLLSEPGRLAKRYLLHDVPFAVRLLSSSTVGRFRKGDAR
ncbi:WecB/TagA/CpsF family glycosyltransferase [Actinoplanes sp. NPDC023714]|uniref:WecB/TagA/CpsF family glycosyltransferase n=1 Tax=Actinoplanes sp. NPDC023714 TaxID=3154322 RepID=UPI0034057D84